MTVPIRTLDVKPKIPQPIESIRALSENLWFVWNYEGEGLFRQMNPDLWEDIRENPVEFLGRLKQSELPGEGQAAI